MSPKAWCLWNINFVSPVKNVTRKPLNRLLYPCVQVLLDAISLWDAMRETASNGITQTVTIYNSLSTTAWTSFGIFAIVHALLDRVDGCARPTRFATSLTFVSRTLRSADTFIRLSLCGVILKYTKITNLYLWCHSYRASSGLNKSQIITAKQPEL